jgi:hypothetical protein
MYIINYDKKIFKFKTQLLIGCEKYSNWINKLTREYYMSHAILRKGLLP